MKKQIWINGTLDYRTVWVNGCFDVLHMGHLRLLEYAASIGDVHVGIDSDRRIREMKGNDRPIYTQEERAFHLSSLKCVDKVSIFDSDDELISQIKALSPDFMVIGEEYHGKDIIGVGLPKIVLFYPKVENYSSTSIIDKILSLKK